MDTKERRTEKYRETTRGERNKRERERERDGGDKYAWILKDGFS